MTTDPTGDAIELRLPLKLEYLVVVRGLVGVVAGTLNFNYDEVMQLRVALSEVFEMATHLEEHEAEANPRDVMISFQPRSDGLEIRVAAEVGLVREIVGERGDESRALLDSLMDSVEYDTDGAVRMVKCRSADKQA